LSSSTPPAPEPSAPATAPGPPGRLKHYFIRYTIRFFVGCYLRVRFEGADRIPGGTPYVLNFNHPNWVDPFLVASHWPDRPRLFIFGPKEEDMRIGWRNRAITWSRMALPFKPSRTNLLDTTRRATGVLAAGYVLAIAAEGRLSEGEGEMANLQEGAAFIALRAGVPIVPLAIIGTRWLRFGKRVTMRVGRPLYPGGRRADRRSVGALTAELRVAMEEMLAGAHEEPPPGRFGRWLTDVFNERPWLEEQKDHHDH
jgi:1-acyl-sn-glycerol-3-phosphate acyltransferase